MKPFSICLFLAFSLCFSFQSFANTPDNLDSRQLRRQVSRMIEAPELDELGISETYVFVNFEINENNEIVVLEVLADDERLSRHVFENLNKRKVNARGLEIEDTYNIKIAFRKEKNS